MRAVVMLMLLGCGPSSTRLLVHIDPAASGSFASLQLAVQLDGQSTQVMRSLPPTLPGTVQIVVPDLVATYVVTATGRDGSGRTLFVTGRVTSIVHQQAFLELSFAGASTDLAGPDVAAADGASTVQCPSDVLLCDDFEGSSIDFIRWQQQDQVNGSIALDNTTIAARGRQSLHARLNAVGAGVQAFAGLNHQELVRLPDPTFVRAFFYADAIPGGDIDLSALSSGGGADGVKLVSFNAPAVLGYDGWGASAATGLASLTAVPLGRWFCLEWRVDVGAGKLSLSLDDTPLPGLQNVTWPMPASFTKVFIGLAASNVSAMEVWIDEVIVDSKSIGCAK